MSSLSDTDPPSAPLQTPPAGLLSCYKQLALAGNLAKEENYQIPVEINGETTAIHLRVLHDKTEGGKVTAAL